MWVFASNNKKEFDGLFWRAGTPSATFFIARGQNRRGTSSQMPYLVLSTIFSLRIREAGVHKTKWLSLIAQSQSISAWLFESGQRRAVIWRPSVMRPGCGGLANS